MARWKQATKLSSLTLGVLNRGRLREKIFFVHIPKCGGVSISNAIARNYGLGARLGMTSFNVDPAASSAAAHRGGVEVQELRRLLTLYAGSRASVRYVSGHVQYGLDALPEDEWNLVSVLRDPVDKWFSQYFYNRYKASSHSRVEEDLDEFIDTPAAREYGSDYLSYLGSWECRGAETTAAAVANLRHFSVIGVLEELDRFAEDFRTRFGVTLRIPRRNGNPVPLQVRRGRIDAEMRRRVELLCEPNRAVYEAALELARL